MWTPKVVVVVAKFKLDFYKSAYYNSMSPVPVELKKGGQVTIYPIKLKDLGVYNWTKTLLEIDKNAIPDPEVISMSYLEYLVKRVFQEEEDGVDKLVWLFKLCLHEDNINVIEQDNQLRIVVLDENNTIKAIVTSNELEFIGKIIISYNDPDYDDKLENASEDVKEVVEEYIKAKYGNTYVPPLEKVMAYVSSKTGKSFTELSEMYYREFELVYSSLREVDIWFGNKILQGSSKYEFKQDILFPLNVPPRSILSEAFTTTDVLNNKGIGTLDL